MKSAHESSDADCNDSDENMDQAKDKIHLNNLAVEVKSVVKTYGHGNQKTSALVETTMAVPRGCIYGLLGPSGCGKTTLLRCILGRVNIDAGSINTLGKKPGSYGHEVPGRKVGYMPQELALYASFTVDETLSYFGQLYKMKSNETSARVQFLLEFLSLPGSSRMIQTLSGGQQRRVSFAVALLHKPELLILDEPTVGVDPLLRQRIWKHLVDIAREDNTTIIITTHYIEEARQADMVGLMRQGRLLAESSPQDLITSHALTTLEEVFLKLCNMDQSMDIELENESFCLKESNLSHQHAEGKSGVKGQSLKLDKISALPKQKDECCAMMLQYVPKFSNIWALFIKNLRIMSRDIGFLIFEFFIPALLVIILCLCIGPIPFDLDLAVVNKDTSDLSVKFLKLVNNRTIVQHFYTDIAAGYESVKQGKTWGLVTLDETFSVDLLNRYIQLSNVTSDALLQGSAIHLYLDMTDYEVAYVILTELQASFQKFSETMLKVFGQNPTKFQAPIQIEEPVFGEREPNFTHYMAPGFISCTTIFLSTGLIAYVFVAEKRQCLMDRSCVAGVTMTEIMIGHIMNQCVVMILQVALLLVVTLLVFQIPCNGSVVLLVILTLCQGLCGMTLGLLISVMVDAEIATLQITLGIVYSNMLLCGMMWPLQAIPYWIRYISYTLPMTHGAEAMRCVMSRGWSITDVAVWRGFLVLIGSSILMFIISVLIVRIRKL